MSRGWNCSNGVLPISGGNREGDWQSSFKVAQGKATPRFHFSPVRRVAGSDQQKEFVASGAFVQSGEEHPLPQFFGHGLLQHPRAVALAAPEHLAVSDEHEGGDSLSHVGSICLAARVKIDGECIGHRFVEGLDDARLLS